MYRYLFAFFVCCFALAVGAVVLRSNALPQEATAAVQCTRYYSPTGPWNTKIGANPRISARSAEHVAALSGIFGSDPTQYSVPIYETASTAPQKRVTYTGIYSNVTNNGQTLNRTSGGGTVMVPIPDNAEPSRGTDSLISVVATDTGDEWGFYRAYRNTDGSWSATNGYHYNVTWSGAPPAGFMSRGAGLPYLAGTIRKCEVLQGTIDHALTFGYDYPCSSAQCLAQGYPYFIYPATKSDGIGASAADFPEGTRLQLKPDATAAEITAWCGSDATCRMIVRALQEYGMVATDNSGHPKITPEGEESAAWGSLLTADTVSKIPYSAFRVIDILSAPPAPDTIPPSTPTNLILQLL